MMCRHKRSVPCSSTSCSTAGQWRRRQQQRRQQWWGQQWWAQQDGHHLAGHHYSLCSGGKPLACLHTKHIRLTHHVCKWDAATPPASSRSLLIRLGQFCKRICSLVMCHYPPKIWVTSCDRNGLLKGMIAHACLAPQTGVCVCRWRQL